MLNVSYNSDNTMEQIITQLKQLGLNDHEAQVYFTLLSASPSSASFIAKKCHLSRSSVYTTLSMLISKGLVGTTFKNNVKQFIAEDDASLELYLKKEKQSLEEKYKSLELIKKGFSFFDQSGAHIPQVVFFEGQEGLKKIYLSLMRNARDNETLYLLRDEFVWKPEWKFIFEQEWHDRVKRYKVEKNIKTKLLINNSKIEKEHAKQYRSKNYLNVSYLQTKHSVKQFAIYLIGDVIAIMSMEKNNLVGIKITNRSMAENFKAMFDGMWKTTK